MKLTEETAINYFERLFNLEKSGKEFPVNLEDVWPVCYSSKNKAIKSLRTNFIEGVDFNLTQKGKVVHTNDLRNGIRVDCEVTVNCLEWFVARKVRPIFECYTEVRKLVQSGTVTITGDITKLDALKMAIESEEGRLLLEKENERKSVIIDIQTRELQESAPKVDFFDTVMQSKATYIISKIASELGLSGRALNKILNEKGVIYSRSGTWLLYSKFQGKGYTKTETHSYTDTGGRTQTNMLTVWTEAGRKFIHDLIKKEEDAA